MAKSQPRWPSLPGLGAAGREIWQRTHSEWTDLSAHESFLLEQVARCADRCVELQDLIDADGIMLGGRMHPALSSLRQERLVLARLAVTLGLPLGQDEGSDKAHGSVRGVYRMGGK